MPEKKKTAQKTIICTMPKAEPGAATLFQKDGMNYYVPINKAVMVPEWVYDLWLDSSWNPERGLPEEVKSHLQD